MAARPAPCLVVLRDEVNAEHPGRDTRSDGWIGDPRHQASGRPENGGSRHNPNRRGVVNARDLDSSHLDVPRLVGCAVRHPSTRNIIYNRKIRSKGAGGLTRVHAYHGPNPHTQHVHVDVELDPAKENDRRPWGYHRTAVARKPTVVVPARDDGGNTMAGGMTRMPVLRRNPGRQMASARVLQRGLLKLGYSIGRAGVDGRFGGATFRAVRSFQRRHGLTADGIVGTKTWTALAQALIVKAGGSTRIDGRFGKVTALATWVFQRRHGLTGDAIVGPRTWAKLVA